jgi:flagellar basal body-associated protein FliL
MKIDLEEYLDHHDHNFKDISRNILMAKTTDELRKTLPIL